MAALPQSEISLLTLEQYLGTSYRPDCEFVDGVLEEKVMGERDHSTLQIAIGAWFFNRRKEWRIVAMSEQRTRVSASRVRLPDICLVSADAPYEKVTLTPPLLAIELLSPEDRLARVIERLEDFHRMGVETIWLIDPADGTGFTYVNSSLTLVSSGRLEVAGTPIFLDLPELFASIT